MITINKDQLEEFIQIYKKEFGKNISDKDARESATSLVNLLELIYKPMTQAEFDEFSKKEN